MDRRPNFVLFLADQLRADHLGCYGNPVVRTPNVDQLARSGWQARRCFVASPVCMPNRASLVTGRMPSVHGVRGNGYGLPLDSNTFVDVLRTSGYRTGLVGKSHLQNITGAAPLIPADATLRRNGEARAPAGGRYDQESAPCWRAEPGRDIDLPYYGFDTVRLSIAHGDDQEGHYRRWLRAQRPDAEALIGRENARPSPEFQLVAANQAWRTRVPEELYPSRWCADESVAFIESAARERHPFFLLCSFPDPHHPFTPPGRYWSMYRPEGIELPRSFAAPHSKPPRQARLLWEARDSGKAVRDGPDAFACTEREAREAIALNYGMISCIDDAVGRVMAALRGLDLGGNTVTAFTSDHGDFMGDHQLLLKTAIHYEGVTRVPLIWCDPAAVLSGVDDVLIGTIDIAPTILARAGLPAYNGMQGRSLLDLEGKPQASWRQTLLIEQESQRSVPGFAPPMRMRTLLAGDYRLTVYEEGGEGELYDLRTDPDELTNLWSSASHAPLRAELLHELIRSMLAHGETSPFPSARA